MSDTTSGQAATHEPHAFPLCHDYQRNSAICYDTEPAMTTNQTPERHQHGGTDAPECTTCKGREQTPDSAHDDAVERLMSPQPRMKTIDEFKAMLRQELEARYEAGRRDVLRECTAEARANAHSKLLSDQYEPMWFAVTNRLAALATPTETKPT